LARHEPNIRASARSELKPDELLPTELPEDCDRQEAIARFLSGSEGWDEAMRRLGGAFAVTATGLRERKAD
jgi:hypothetical protein